MSIVHVTFYPSTRNFLCIRCSNIFSWNQSLKGVWTFHYTLRSRLIVLPRSLCFLPSLRKHRKLENASGIPTKSMNAFHSTYFFFFSMFQCGFAGFPPDALASPLARLLGELARRLGGAWGLWARNVAHRTCRKLCVLSTLKQNSVRVYRLPQQCSPR